MDEAEESEEMAALVALDEFKAKYGSMMTAQEYKKRKQEGHPRELLRPDVRFCWPWLQGARQVHLA